MVDTTRFTVDAICFDLLTALLDSWSLWETVAAGAGYPGHGQKWRTTALSVVTASGDYRPYAEAIAEGTARAGLPLKLTAALLGRWAELRPFPEVPAMLARLVARGKPLATATNCPETLARQGSAALGDPFSVVVSAERAGAYKPDPRPYRLALTELGQPAERVLFVAGSPHDLGGALAVGMPVVWVNRLNVPAPPAVRDAVVVTDLSGLPDLLA